MEIRKNPDYTNLNRYYENGNQLLGNRENTAVDTQIKDELAEES
jgi:hypothetical protein